MRLASKLIITAAAILFALSVFLNILFYWLDAQLILSPSTTFVAAVHITIVAALVFFVVTVVKSVYAAHRENTKE